MKDLSHQQWRATYEQLREDGFLDVTDMRIMGYRQTNPRLLWLPRFGAPIFQFKDGKLIDVVAKVNQLLATAGHNPHQLAFWWINPDPDSGESPIELIGKPKILWRLAQQSKK